MRRRLVPVVLLPLLALVAAACGSQGTISATPETVEGTLTVPTTEEVEVPEGDPAAGKEIYNASGCGGCHTLADAGTTGTVGPNLDDAQPSLEKAFTQIRDGGGGMPAYADQLDEQQIADVAAYVVQATSG
jgi:mono/diheme cytochrome c family protein